MALPPGPSSPSLVQLLEWSWRPERYMRSAHERYGDIFTAQLRFQGPDGPSPAVFLADPEAVKTLFRTSPDHAPVGASRQSLSPMFGSRSVLLVDGAEHLRQRKLMLPPFHGRRMAAYGELIEEIAEDELDAWPLDKSFALQPHMQAITLEVILRAVFGLEDLERRAEMRERISDLLASVSNPLAELAIGLPRKIGPVNIRAGFERVLKKADETLLREIRRARSDPALDKRDDILSMLLQAHDDEGGTMSDGELRDQLVTLLLAGHETTATGLAWAFNHLYRRPEALERLTTECRDENGEGPYLDAVVNEVLRLRPPVPITDRTLAAPLELSGYELAAGTIVAPCIYLLHRRADLYPEPDEFRPERFLDASPETYSWIPFGGGVRRCLGASFATFEMKIVLRTILRRARLKAASDRPETSRRRSIVLAPRRGTRSVLLERGPRSPRRKMPTPVPASAP
jgi:cytochrome P450